ncbi:hypothetical protein STAFG_2391 [Streptomyces afghaniensis 772]|uniref:Uncharacterized protein n=1 Tax=Streptomyces afghaniensis 772 TaxID=1283301 RepID=S4MM00_9ACTN|nr:hypothetical protein STAFG_2391 [Streptomyces afghaniensis 772]
MPCLASRAAGRTTPGRSRVAQMISTTWPTQAGAPPDQCGFLTSRAHAGNRHPHHSMSLGCR